MNYKKIKSLIELATEDEWKVLKKLPYIDNDCPSGEIIIHVIKFDAINVIMNKIYDGKRTIEISFSSMDKDGKRWMNYPELRYDRKTLTKRKFKGSIESYLKSIGLINGRKRKKNTQGIA